VSAGYYNWVEESGIFKLIEHQGPLEPMMSKSEHAIGICLNQCFGGIMLPGGDVRKTRMFIRTLKKAGYEITKL